MKKRPIWLQLLFCFALSLAFLGAVICFLLLKMSCDINKKTNEIIIATVDNPECFLPKSDQELKAMLKKVRRNPAWKMFSSEESKRFEKGTVAYREFGPFDLVTLVKTKERTDEWVTSEADCNEKKINLRVHWDLKSGLLRSNLLVKNGEFGLSIIEWSGDRERKFTNEALRIVRDEMTKP